MAALSQVIRSPCKPVRPPFTDLLTPPLTPSFYSLPVFHWYLLQIESEMTRKLWSVFTKTMTRRSYDFEQRTVLERFCSGRTEHLFSVLAVTCFLVATVNWVLLSLLTPIQLKNKNKKKLNSAWQDGTKSTKNTLSQNGPMYSLKSQKLNLCKHKRTCIKYAWELLFKAFVSRTTERPSLISGNLQTNKRKCLLIHLKHQVVLFRTTHVVSSLLSWNIFSSV